MARLTAVLGDDVYRGCAQRSAGAIALWFVRARGYRPIATYRLYHAWGGTSLGRFARIPVAILHRWFCAAGAMDLPLRAQYGPGLFIAHGWGLVVSRGAVIGRNATLFHGVTIGQCDRISRDGVRETTYPVVGNNVWIGPHAAVLGGITIGDGARILAGAVVTFDVPARTMVGGNPAQILREDVMADVVNPI